MSKKNSNTTMGGNIETFRNLNTEWTKFQQIKDGDEAIRIQLINNLMEKYWKPACCFLRKKTCDNELAKDLTQGFFCDMVLQDGLFQKANKEKGRFRDFMKVSLKNYLNNYRKQQQTQKRMPRGGIISLDDANIPELPQQEEMDADQIFYYSWTANLLDDVLDAVRQHYVNKGMDTHWLVFSARVVVPIKEITKEPSRKELCQKYNITDEQTISGMVANVKRRFRTTLECKLQRAEQTDSDINEEIKRLEKFLAKKRPPKDDKDKNDDE